VLRKLKIPYGVVINRSDLGDEKLIFTVKMKDTNINENTV